MSKCKNELAKSQARVKELNEEVLRLKEGVANAEGEEGMTVLATERIASEWKQRIEDVEQQWTERINKVSTFI